jgi:transcriptional regulator with XRE-family HTH domain
MRSRNSREYKSLLAGERLVVEATEAVYEAMERAGVNKKELASRLDVRPSEISQRLSGRRNLTLRSFAAMMEALGVRAKLAIEDSTAPYTPGARWITPQSGAAQTVINATNAIVFINGLRGIEHHITGGTNVVDFGSQVAPLQRSLETVAPNELTVSDRFASVPLAIGGAPTEVVEVDSQ